jgi:glyoxalase family protein
MSTLVKGLHHITLCPGRAQEDVDFFTQVLGQRLVKQTVLLDGRIPIYHLYYGNADADLGSIATTFPYRRKPGRAGTGQVTATAYSVPLGSLRFWAEHFDRHGAEHSGILERFGARFIRVRHPAGLLFDMVEQAGDLRRPWTTSAIGAEVATRGFFGAVMSVREICDQETFLVEALGLRKVGVDGSCYRFEIPGVGPDRIIDLVHEPERASGSWGFGQGTAHHLAFNLETDEALVQQKALYEELGYTDASELKDRYYFHSMYVRSPGGILIECTANVPGGFYMDEEPDALGTELHLPPWYEEHRDAILSVLEPLIVPEENRPKPGTVRRPAAALPSQRTSPGGLSRTRAAFMIEKG